MRKFILHWAFGLAESVCNAVAFNKEELRKKKGKSIMCRRNDNTTSFDSVPIRIMLFVIRNKCKKKKNRKRNKCFCFLPLKLQFLPFRLGSIIFIYLLQIYYGDASSTRVCLHVKQSIIIIRTCMCKLRMVSYEYCRLDEYELLTVKEKKRKNFNRIMFCSHTHTSFGFLFYFLCANNFIEERIYYVVDLQITLCEYNLNKYFFFLFVR